MTRKIEKVKSTLFLAVLLLNINTSPFTETALALDDTKAKKSKHHNRRGHDDQSIIVCFSKTATEDAIEEILYLVNGKIKDKDKDRKDDSYTNILEGRLALIELKGGITAEEAIAILEGNSAVDYIELNIMVHVDAVPNDPSFGELWGLQNTGQQGGVAGADISAVTAWDTTTGSPDIVVGVVDTGVDYNHQDLASNMWTNPQEIAGNGVDDDNNGYIDDIHGINAVTGAAAPGDPMDIDTISHGTHVSGIIGAAGSNGTGVVGVNWDVKIIGMKFLNLSGSTGLISDAIKCIDYAIGLKNSGVNLRILNNSWGVSTFSQAMKDAITAANAAGILFVAATGNNANDNDITKHYPANYDVANVLSVASTDRNDDLSTFSDFGATSVDMGAPGSDILSTIRNNSYSTLNGTSMAAPHVSGAAALMLAFNNELTVADMKGILLNSGDSISSLSGKTVSGKRLNVASALSQVPAPVPSFEISATPSIQTVNQGESAIYNVAVNPLLGFSGSVSLSAIATPALNANITFSPNPVNTGASSTMNITTTTASVTGDYTIEITGVSGTITKTATLQLTVQASGTVVKTYNNTNQINIPDNDPTGITSTINVPDVLTISDASVTVNITHTSVVDLVIDITSPSGTKVTLHNQTSGPPNISKTYPLPNFNGLNGRGDWALNVADVLFQDNGTLDNWSLSLTGTIASPPPNQPPVVTILAPLDNAVFTQGDTISFSGSALDNEDGDLSNLLTWTSSIDGEIGLGATFSATTLSTGTHIITATATDSTLKAGSSSITITVNAVIPNVPPTADFSFSTTGLSASFTDLSSDTDGVINSWSWDFGDGSISNLQNPTHAYTIAGTYNVSLIVIDEDGDTGTTNKSVTVTEPEPVIPNVQPTADFSFTVTELNVSFNDLSSDSDGIINAWSWNFGDGFTSNLQNPQHSYAIAGTYNVSLIVTDDAWNTGTTSKSVNVTAPIIPNVPPIADFSFTTTGLIAIFTDLSSDSDGIIATRSWDFGDDFTSSLQNPTHFYEVAGTYNVSLRVTDNKGNIANTSKSVTVTDPVIPNVTPTADFSFTVTDLNVNFTDLSSDSDGVITAWSWNFDDGSSANIQNPQHSYGIAGTYTVSLIVTDNNGGTSTTSKAVTVTDPIILNAPPVADFSFTANNLTVDFTDFSTDTDGVVTAWSWSFNDGSTSNLQNPQHSYAIAGTYNVSLTVTDNHGNSSITSKSVTVTEPIVLNTPPVADFSFAGTDLLVRFNDLSTDTDGVIISWSWDFGNGATSHLQNPVHTYVLPGTYTVSLNVVDDAGGNDTVTKSVSVTEPAIQNNTLTADFSFSVTGLSVMFTDLSINTGENDILGWSWEFGDGEFSNLQNPEHNYLVGGTYNVTLHVINSVAELDTVKKSVTVTDPVLPNNPSVTNLAPTADFSFSTTDLNVNFTDLSNDLDGTVIAWLWDFGDGAASDLQNPSHSYISAGDYTVSLSVTDNTSDTATVSKLVTVIESIVPSNPAATNVVPMADFSFITTNLTVSFTDLSNDSDGTITSWLWDFADGETSDLQNPTHSYLLPGDYDVSLSVTDNIGDTTTVSKFVTVIEPIAPIAPSNPPVINIPPTVDFSFSITDLTVNFTDLSTDFEGAINVWAWDFGDNQTSNLQNPTHSYMFPGEYTVSLSVTDNAGDTVTVSKVVIVNASIGTIELNLVKKRLRINGKKIVRLNWAGAKTPRVVIYRNGNAIANIFNRGKYRDKIRNEENGPFEYQISELSGTGSSNLLSVSF